MRVVCLGSVTIENRYWLHTSSIFYPVASFYDTRTHLLQERHRELEPGPAEGDVHGRYHARRREPARVRAVPRGLLQRGGGEHGVRPNPNPLSPPPECRCFSRAARHQPVGPALSCCERLLRSGGDSGLFGPQRAPSPTGSCTRPTRAKI